MKEINPEELLRYYKKETRRRSVGKRVVFTLSLIVVFCTVYSLILPAITMVNEDIAICGFEEHTHGEECYAEKELLSFVCDGIHVHNATCFDAQGSCRCGFADYVIHTHDENCYNADGELCCTLPEVAEHTHDETCVRCQTEYVCGKEEHTHSDECFTEEKNLVCGLTDESHEHTDECYETVKTLICEKEEHSHSAECAVSENKMVCGCEEPVYHAHTDACYNAAGELVCGKTEVTAAAFHQHTESCYADGGLICGHIELLRHQHSDCAVRTTEKVLICGLPEHIHDDACLPERSETVKEKEFTCGFSYEHTHGDDCYKNGTLTCTLTEHTHTPECRRNMTADKESPEGMAKVFEKIERTGDINKDVTAVVQTQVGYKESDRNFITDETGEYKGYTRYGDWYGDPYADWNVLFCSCCLHYAGISKDVFPVYADVAAWLATATDAGLRREAGEYQPIPGDIVFVKSSADEAVPAKMGFVLEVKKTDGLTVRCAEGDCEDRVCDDKLYSADEILCFCVLPGSAEAEANKPVLLTTETDNGITVTVEALPSSLPFPADELSIRAQLVENDTADRLTSEELEENGLTPVQKLYFDIKLIHDGEEVEPLGPLTVSISGIAGQGTSAVEVYHIDTVNEELETMEAQLDDEQSVNIETDHFSLYAVSLLAATDVSSLTELPLSNGGSFTMDKDYKITSTKNISRNTTLDLNGHNLYVTCDPAFNVTGGMLTINDSQGPEASVQTVTGGSMNSNTAEYASAQRIGTASFTAPSSSTFSPWGDGAVANLFDNNAGTKMGGNVTGGSVTVEFVPSDTSAIITSYVLTSAGDTANYSSRVPKSWVLSGQRSGSSTWTQISSVSSMPVDSSTDHTYTTTATQAYAKYRIVFQTNSAFQMADLKLYSASDEKLTYYVTETQITDAATGETAETLKKYTVTPSDGGLIVGNQNGRFITMSGGTVNLNGGYITNFSKSVNTEDSRGGAIKATGGTLNLDGAVLAGNKASDGGAIQVTGNNTVLNIRSGVISGNDATRAHQFPTSESRYGGGGVYMGPGSTVNMSGGYVTNNICSNAAGATHGGGAFMVNGAHLNISGGYLTGNGGPGGGAIMTSRASSYAAGGKIYMTGGFITANTSYTKEGGGVSIDGYGYMSLTGGYVTNNVASGGVNNANFHDWGGGGIFVSDAQALLYIENVLITENKAGGFGGGIAGCSTGRLNIAVDDVCASYDNYALGEHLSGAGNQKNEDHAYAAENEQFMANGYNDYYCALSSIVSGGMLGEGTAYWTGTMDNETVRSTSRDDVLTAASVMGLTAHPTDEDKANASAAAQVFINGNESPTHGGGILANGYLMIGPQKIESFCRLEFNATKTLINGSGSSVSLGSRVFRFAVEDEYGTVLVTGENNSNGNITFDGRISFMSAGVFTYYAYETENTEDGGTKIVTDGARYKIEVEVEKISSTITVDDKNYTKEVFQFKRVTVYDAATGTQIKNYRTSDGTLSNNENHAVSLDPTGGRAFNNYNVTYITPSVKKVWVGSGSHPAVTVHLLRNGEVISTQTLSSSNNWQYSWSRQNTVVNSRPAVYTVTEDPVNGYVTSYSVTNSNGSSTDRMTQLTTITNTPVASVDYTLNIKKVSEEDNTVLLPGASFEIRDAGGNTLKFLYNAENGRYTLSNASSAGTTLVTAATGYIRADGFPAGTYTVTETSAPSGYAKVSPFTVTLNNTVPGQVLSVTVEDPEYKGGPIMPATGGVGTTPVYVLAAVLLTASAALFRFTFRRRKDRGTTV